MRTHTKEDLKQVLKAHQEWINSDGGSWANLSGANLSGATLSWADLSGAENIPGRIIKKRSILSEGAIIGYKKLSGGTICKIRIPKNARRVGGVTGRKCRAEYAIVVEGEGVSQHDRTVSYKVGKKMIPNKFDDNPLVECSSGIHFFITREEAEDY